MFFPANVRETEVLGHQFNQAVRSNVTARDENELNGCAELTHELAQQDRFTCAHFACKEHQSSLGFNSINKGGQSLEIKGVAVEEARIRRYPEWRFSKPKMTLKGGGLFLGAEQFN